MTRRYPMAAGAALLALALPTGPRAAEPAVKPPYLGTWIIAEARAAPWVAEAPRESAAETRRLIGKLVIYARGRISGPDPLACNKPNYRLYDAPIEQLFQGGLTMPGPQAAKLGFGGPTAPTLETGCGGAIDFHYTDASTALFALDNMIYTLRRK